MTRPPITHPSNGTAQAIDIPVGVKLAAGSGVLLLSLNSAMIAVAIPAIALAFQADTGTAWLVASLYIAAAVAAPTAGRLTDLFGAKPIYLIGLGLLAIGAAVGLSAGNITVLIISRVLIGLGGASQYPAGVAMLKQYARTTGRTPTNALAVISIMSQTAVAFGPTLGGVLVVWGGWQGIYWVNFPLIAVAAVWIVKAVPVSAPREGEHPQKVDLKTIDLPGLLTFAIATVAIMSSLLSIGRHQFLWWPLPIAAVALALHIWRELHTSTPFLDLRVLKTPALSRTYLRTLVTYSAFYLIFYGLPQWLISGRSLSPAMAGLVILPIALVGIGSTMTGTYIQKRYGVRTTLLLGNTAMILAGLAWSFITAHSAIFVLFLAAALTGVPNGLNSMGNQSTMFAASPAQHTGAASGVYRTCQYLAAALAAAIVELVFTPGNIESANRILGWTISAAGLILAIAAMFRSKTRTPR